VASGMYVRNSTIIAGMAAIYGFVLGFGYGNLFEVQYGFQFKEWQTLGGVLVAVAAATLAYIGVQGTQRINVMTKEQDRLDAMLPGLRQISELLIAIRVLSSLRSTSLYQASLLLDSAIRVAPTESVEDAVRRQLPLADDSLKWEVAQLVFALRRQAEILKIGKEEVDRYRTDVAKIDTFAVNRREGLLGVAKQVKASHKRENDEMQKLIVSLESFATAVKERIATAEQRQKVIRGIVDQFFK
jgi:hypothetical protein